MSHPSSKRPSRLPFERRLDLEAAARRAATAPDLFDLEENAMALSKLQQARLVYGWGHRLDDLRLYGFTSSNRPLQDAEGMLSFHWNARCVRPALNDQAGRVMVLNKWLFYRLMDGYRLPIPRTLGLWDPVHGTSWDGERVLHTLDDVLAEIARARCAGLVLKPAGGTQGSGVLILDTIDHESGLAVTRTGVESELEQALARVELPRDSGAPGVVLQVPVPSHPMVHELAPWTTNTLRVVTLVDLAGHVHVQGAAITLGRKGQMVNNWHAGGVNVSIDTTTGGMGRGVLADPVQWVEEHPDSGARLVGARVPDWEDVVALCRRAALLLPGLRSLGWDVVVGPDGPVLLEANDDWDLQGIQVHSRGFLSDVEMRDRLLAAGAPLPTEGAVTRHGPRRLAGQVKDLWRARRSPVSGVPGEAAQLNVKGGGEGLPVPLDATDARR